MSTDPRLNGAGSPLVLYETVDEEVRTVTFIMHPMSDRDITELDEWVRGVYIENARRSLRPETPRKERDETLRIAMDQAMGLSFMHGTGAKMMGTVEGVVQMMLQSCKKSHPDLTAERLRTLLFNKTNVLSVNEKWRALNLRKNPTTPPSPVKATTAERLDKAPRRKRAKTKSASTVRSRKSTTSRPNR